MKEKIIEQIEDVSASSVRLASIALGTLLLYLSMIVKTYFVLQLLIFLFVLYVSREYLGEGFDALGELNPNVGTLVLICTLASLMHGVAIWDTDNFFANSSLTLLLISVGEKLSSRFTNDPYRASKAVNEASRIALYVSLGTFAVTFFVFLGTKIGLPKSLIKSLFVLSCSCPCTVGIIYPLACFICAFCASNHGIEINGEGALEKLNRVEEVYFSTETVVTNQKYICEVYSYDGNPYSVLSVCAAASENLDIKYADALKEAFFKIGEGIPFAEECFETPRGGVAVKIKSSNYLIGEMRAMEEKRIRIPEAVRRTDLNGYKAIYVAKNYAFFGVVIFADKKRMEASGVMKSLSDIGVKSFVLSKEKVLQENKKDDRIITMMVGSFPIRSADVVCTVAPSKSSDVVIDNGSLKGVLNVLLIGRRMATVVRLNLLVSFALSGTFFVFATGLLKYSPSALMISAMSLFTLFVTLLITLNIIKFKPPEIITLEDDVMFGKIHYTMKIEGMSCAHCSARVKTALETLRGVSAKISLEEKVARIKCPASLSVDELTKAVTDVGFAVVSVEKV